MGEEARVLKSRALLTVISCAVLAASAGCGEGQGKLAVPGSFCKVSADKAALADVIPDGESIDHGYRDQGDLGGECEVIVDGTRVIYVIMRNRNQESGEFHWRGLDRPYARKKVTFPGIAKIGKTNAVVQATCDASNSYVTFDFTVQSVRGGSEQKKILHFVNDLVPKETKRLGCTK